MAGFDAFDPERAFKDIAATARVRVARDAAADTMIEACAMLADAGFDIDQQKLLITAILKLAHSKEVREWMKAEGMIE